MLKNHRVGETPDSKVNDRRNTMALTTNVTDAQVEFIDGKLAIKYFNVSISSGVFPNSLNGNVQVTATDGVSITSTPEQVETIAKKKVQDLVADDKTTDA